MKQFFELEFLLTDDHKINITNISMNDKDKALEKINKLLMGQIDYLEWITDSSTVFIVGSHVKAIKVI